METTAASPAPSGLRIATAILAGASVALAMVGVGVYLLEHYGAVLFLAAPLAMGATASVIFHRGLDAGAERTVWIALAPLAPAGAILMAFAVEGLVCLIMALPLALPLALLGGLVGGRVAERDRGGLLLGLVLLPAAAGLEATQPRGGDLHEVLSTIEIDAPADQVWKNVVAFPPLAEPTEWWLRTGLAYPRYAAIEGSGVGAVRYCVFSTGTFVEPITAWEPGRRLAFDVVDSPPPLRELSPYRDVHAPHLDGYLRSRRGEFRLLPLPGGRTRLEGRTWYELDMAPAWYWQWVADRVIHGIHARVLEHIRDQAERPYSRVVKSVGSRHVPGEALVDQGRLARTAAALHPAGLAPAGIYRFHSFEEADQWMLEMLRRRRGRLRRKTSPVSAAP